MLFRSPYARFLVALAIGIGGAFLCLPACSAVAQAQAPDPAPPGLSDVVGVLTDLVSLVQPYVLAMVAVVAVTELVRRGVLALRGPRAFETAGAKLALQGLALVLGIVCGITGIAEPVGPGVAGAIAAGFIVAALAVVNRDVAMRMLRLGREAKSRPALARGFVVDDLLVGLGLVAFVAWVGLRLAVWAGWIGS